MFPSRNTYITIPEAVRKYGVSREALLERIKSGKISAAKLPGGGYLVAENEIDPSLNIKREDFEHLRGRKISMSEASKNYGIPHPTFSRWTKSGFIKVLERGYRTILDEADVAFCAAVYKAKYKFYDGKISGVNIFDEHGNPFQSKFPEMAAYKRALRKRARRKKQTV